MRGVIEFEYLAQALEKAGDIEKAKACYRSVMDSASSVMWAYPDMPEQYQIIGAYMMAAQALGGPESESAVGNLQSQMAASPSCYTLFAARTILNGSEPGWNTLPSMESMLALTESYRLQSIAAKRAGNRDMERALVEKTRDAAWEAIVKNPASAAEVRAVQRYVTALEKLGSEEHKAGMARLQEFVDTSEPCMATFAARASLYAFQAHTMHNWPDATLEIMNLLDEISAGCLDAALKDPATDNLDKAWIGYIHGYALSCMDFNDRAVEAYNRTLTDYPYYGVPQQCVRYGKAFATQKLNAQDPRAGVEAWLEYLDAHPYGELADKALSRVAEIYFKAEDYETGAEVLRELVTNFANSPLAIAAEEAIADAVRQMEERAALKVAAVKVPSPAEIKSAQVCGPVALRKLLLAKGVESTVDELSLLAGTDSTGTSMYGLVQAAKAKGVDLTGVSVPDLTVLKTPFIAYVNGNHFILVNEVREDSVLIADTTRADRAMPAAEFMNAWDGKALVVSAASDGLQELLDPQALRGAKGGCTPQDTLPREDDGCKNLHGIWCCPINRSDGQDISSVQPAASFPGSPKYKVCGLAPNLATEAGIDNAQINVGQGTIQVVESDISATARGGLGLSFTRNYMNPYGAWRWWCTDTSTPYNNNIGRSWNHNLNRYLLVSSLRGYVEYTTELGDQRIFERTQQNVNGYDIYVRGHTDSSTTTIDSWERRWEIKRNVTTGAYTLYMPDGQQYGFAPETTDAARYSRMEWIGDSSGNQFTMVYEANGRLSRVNFPGSDTRRLEFGYAGTNLIAYARLADDTGTLTETQYYYDANNDLTRIRDYAGNDTLYTYATDAPYRHYITAATDKAGRTANLSWQFALIGGFTRTTNVNIAKGTELDLRYSRGSSDGSWTAANYDGSTLINKVRYTTVGGDWLTNTIDYYATPTGQIQRWKYEYDDVYNLTKIYRPSISDGSYSLYKTYTYTSLGQVLTATTEAGTTDLTTTWTYNSGCLYPASMTGPDGLTTTYYYDDASRLTKVVHPGIDSAGIRYAYNGYGQMTSHTDPLGRTTTYAYDASGNLTSITDPLNNTSTLAYDKLGHVTSRTDPLNRTTTYEYALGGCGGCGGASGVVTKVTDARGKETLMEYDVNGNMTKQTDAMGVETDYSYDSLDRVTEITFPSGSGNDTTYVYDKAGRMTAVTDPAGRTTTYGYDGLGRQTSVTTPISSPNPSVTYAYHPSGVLNSVTDALGHTTSYEYDAGLRLTRVNHPGYKYTKYFYDSAGRVTKTGAGADGSFDPTERFYSASTGLLTKVRYGGSYDVDYTYDGNGRIMKTTDWIDGTDGIRLAFDNAGRLTTITDYDDRTLSYVYDAAGQVASMTDYHGKTTSYSYNPTGQISGLTAPGSKVWSYTYNDIGQITQYTHPNGTTTDYGYDGRHRLTSIHHMDGANVLDGFTYLLDDAGNINTVLQSIGPYWVYEYDSGDRLTLAQRRTDEEGILKQWNYTYDLADNMTTKAVYMPGTGTRTTVYTFNSANEAVSEVFNGSSTTNFTYDAWGRTLSKVRDGSTSESYAYRYGGKLYSVTTNYPANSNSTYQYRGDERLYSRTNGGATTRFNYGTGFQVLTEEATDGTLQMSYVHDFITPTGRVLADLAGTDPATGAARYYYHDNIDSTRRIRGADKASLAQYEFDPYGLYYAVSGAESPYKWGPYRMDTSNSMYYTPNRWYVPMQARWLTRDPLGMVDGPNVYAYVRNAPIIHNDPSGENAACIAIGWECAVAEPTPVGECIMACVTIAWGVCKVIEMCRNDDCPDDNPYEEECWAIYTMDMLMCSLVPWPKRRFCEEQAIIRYGECRRFGAPSSPLPYP
jgi:RHS repeat-associated protein